VELEEHGGDQPQQRLVVREDLDDVGAALDLAVEPLDGYLELQFGSWF
jgi:hypothetical protein